MPNGVGAFSHLAFPACLRQSLYADSLLPLPFTAMGVIALTGAVHGGNLG